MAIEVELKHIHKNFGTFKASDDVNLTVEKGKLIGLLGPSGSGKTTILRMIAGLEHPDSGDIFIAGKRVNDLPAGKRGIGFVFQNYALFRHMTVWENIAFGLKVQKVPPKEIAARVDKLVELIGLKEFATRYPQQLSGGQRLDDFPAGDPAEYQVGVALWRDTLYRQGPGGIRCGVGSFGTYPGQDEYPAAAYRNPL